AGAEETAALALYQRQRDQALREVFEITCRLAAYPAVPAFIELQKQLSAAIDSEAAELASWPGPGDRVLATARGEHNRHPSTHTKERYQDDHHRHDRRRG